MLSLTHRQKNGVKYPLVCPTCRNKDCVCIAIANLRGFRLA